MNLDQFLEAFAKAHHLIPLQQLRDGKIRAYMDGLPEPYHSPGYDNLEERICPITATARYLGIRRPKHLISLREQSSFVFTYQDINAESWGKALGLSASLLDLLILASDYADASKIDYEFQVFTRDDIYKIREKLLDIIEK